MSASARKIEANRANAQKSTGPTSAAGKAKSSRNALRHGLTSRDLVIPPDQQDEFDDLSQGLRADLSPQGAAETLLFHQILSAIWRLIRCDRAEAELAVRTTEPDPLLDPALQPVLRAISAARSQARRQQKEATAELRTLQTERRYRAAVVPEEAATDDNREFGLANLRSILPRIRKENDRAELAVINAPVPYISDAELERRAEAIIRRIDNGEPL